MTMSESGSVFGVSAENQTTNTNPSPARAVSMNNVVSSEASVPMFCASLETAPPAVARDTAAVGRNGTAKAVLGPTGGGSLPPGGTGPSETILGAREVPLTAHHWAAYDPGGGDDRETPVPPEVLAALPGLIAEELAGEPAGAAPPAPPTGPSAEFRAAWDRARTILARLRWDREWRGVRRNADPALDEVARLRAKLHRAASEVAYLRYTRRHATEHLLGDLRASQARNDALVSAVAAARAPLLPWWAYYAALAAMALAEIVTVVVTDSLWPMLTTVVAYACGVAAAVSGRVKR